MKKLTAVLLVFIMSLTLVLPVFADDISLVEEDFTVLWCEADSSKLTMILSSDDHSCISMVVDPNGNIGLRSDGSAEGDRLLSFVKKGERIHAGSVITVRWTGDCVDLYPGELGGVTWLTFTDKETMMTSDEVRKIFDSLNELNEADKYAFINYEEMNFKVKTLCTVVGCRYDEEKEFYEMAISYRRPVYWLPYTHYHWSFTTANEGFYLNDKRTVEVKSDGSETGNKALELALKGEPVPLGTVVEILWSGMVLESFPPSLEGIVSYTFTDYDTDYSYDDIISEMDSMNQMRLKEEIKYPVPKKEDMFYAPRFEFVVVNCDTSRVTDGKYHKEGASLYIARNGNYNLNDLYRITPDFEKMAVVRNGNNIGDGKREDEEAIELYEHFLKTGEVPQGTVIEIVWSGMVNESYPAQLAGIYEIRFTSKKTSLSTTEMNNIYNSYADEFDLDRLGETVSSSSSSGDYPAMIMHDNTVYQLVGEIAVNISDDAIIGYTTSYTDGTPVREGETNFSRETGLKYANAELNGVRGIAVHYEGSWHFFKPVYDMAPVPPAEENPKTGTADICAAIALAGILTWIAAVATTKSK